MSASEDFFETVLAHFQKVRSTQWSKIQLAGEWLGESLAKDGWLYAFGTGHSHLLAEEVFYRAGGLARATPILDPRLMLHEAAIQATYNERETGCASQILDRYPVHAGDVLIVASNSGRNAVPIEMAMAGRERGLKVIAITNLNHSLAWPARHPSGKRLADAADLVLDTCGIEGDTATRLASFPYPVGSPSTSTGALLINLIIVAGIESAVRLGYQPEVFISSNTDGDDHNDRLLQKYRPLNPHL